jgi:mitochondrial cardiolipin hydrolase
MKEFTYILEKISSDFRLSRSEQDALNKVINSKNFTDQQLSVLRSQLFDYSKSIINEQNAQDVLTCLEDINKLLIPTTPDTHSASSWFSPGTDCRDNIIAQIKQAQSSIDICVFTISDNIISEVIIDTWNSGVKIRIITDDDKQFDRGSDIALLRNAGIPVVTDKTPDHMHHKFAIFDKVIVICGSYNWTRSATLNNNEDIVIFDHKEAVNGFVQEFEKLWNEYSK